MKQAFHKDYGSLGCRVIPPHRADTRKFIPTLITNDIPPIRIVVLHGGCCADRFRLAVLLLLGRQIILSVNQMSVNWNALNHHGTSLLPFRKLGGRLENAATRIRPRLHCLYARSF